MDEECAAPLVRPTRGKNWSWLSVPAAALVCVGVIGFAHLPRVTTVQRIKGIHSKAMKIAARMLEADQTETVSFDYSSVADGDAEPSAMEYNLELVPDETIGDGDSPKPEVKITFVAKAGKRDELLRLFKNVLDGAIEHERTDSGEDAAKGMEQVIDVSAGGDDEVVISVLAPDDEDKNKMEDEMQKSFELAKPTFKVTVKVGRTWSEMLAHKADSLAVVSGGVAVSAETTVASALLESLEEDVEAGNPAIEQAKIALAFKSVNFQSHNVYYKDKVAAIADVPSLGDMFSMVGGKAHAMLPAAVRDPLIGLDEFSAGIRSVSMLGLPGKMKMDVKMSNVRVAPLIKELLGDIKEA